VQRSDVAHQRIQPIKQKPPTRLHTDMGVLWIELQFEGEHRSNQNGYDDGK
jgi:hypothetical protein